MGDALGGDWILQRALNEMAGLFWEREKKNREECLEMQRVCRMTNVYEVK